MTKIPPIEDAIYLVRQCPDVIGIALLQRYFCLGYNAAKNVMSELIAMGVVTEVGAKAQGKHYLLCVSNNGVHSKLT